VYLLRDAIVLPGRLLRKSASGVLAALRGARDWLRHQPVPVPLSDGDSHRSGKVAVPFT